MDCWLDWNDDFVADASGDLLMASGVDLANQSIVRRVMTAVQGYVFHPEYGAGLPQKIGGVYQPSTIKAIVQSQVALDANVDQSKAVVVDVAALDGGVNVVTISYTAASTSEAAVLSFTL